MPDGARFERGGEFIEAGYDAFRRRAAEYDLPLVPQGFAFAAREVRSGGRTLPTLLLDAERELAATVDALGTDAAAATSAADALARTPLEPLARRALREAARGDVHGGARPRFGDLALERRAAGGRHSRGFRAPGRRQRRPGEGDGLGAGRARAARLCHRASSARSRTSIASCWQSRFRSPSDRLLPALRERGSYGRLQWGVAAKLHVPLAEPAAARGGAGARSRVLDVDDRCVDRRRLVRRRPRRASSRSRSGSAPSAGAPPFGGCGPSSACAAMRCSRAGGTTIPGAAARTPAIRRGGRSETTRRSQRPAGRIHLAGEHTAAEFCGTMEGALRSGARAASEVLAEARSNG